MITLFIDTSFEEVSVFLVQDGKVLARICRSIPNEHSIYTTYYLDVVLKEANILPNDVDKIMVVNGPGSFTGIRIGVTIAKVYAYVLKKDVVCVSSLKMRAISIEHDYCLSLIYAKRNHYYLGLYDKNNNEVISEQFHDRDFVLDLIEKYHPIIVSDRDIEDNGLKCKKGELDVVKIVDYYQDGEVINWHQVVPNYLKLPQAMEKRND